MRVRAALDGGQWVTQVVPQDGNELLAQLCRRLLIEDLCTALGQLLVGFEVVGDQLGEEPKHAHRRLVLELRRLGIDGAERPEEGTVRQDDWNGDVALQVVKTRRVMRGVDRIFRNVVDDDFLATPRTSWHSVVSTLSSPPAGETEMDVVEDFARHPAVFGDPRHGRKSHSGSLTNDIQDRRDGTDLLDRGDIILDVGHSAKIRRPRM